MLTSLAFIFLAGLAMAGICGRLGLPRIIGMLFTGILLGPNVFNLLDSSILLISPQLRQMALIIILLKAGLSLNLSDLRQVGRPAVMMSFVPASFEILAFLLFGPFILGISRVEAALLGSVLAAVSPAVVIPRMVQLMEEKYGTDKSIPQMIMAGASCDDIFVIVLFSTFLGMAQGGSVRAADFLNIPVSIVLGILLGAVFGYGLSCFFERAYEKKHYIRNSMKVVVVLGMSFLLMSVEAWLEDVVSVSGLLELSHIEASYAVRAVFKRKKWPLRDVTSGHIESVLALLRGRTGAGSDLPGGLRAERSYDRLILTKLQPGQTEKRDESGLPSLFMEVADRENQGEIPKNLYTKWFDYDKIKDTLSVRYRLPGDYITLKGGGRKSLKSLFIDEKIPREERSHIPLLAEGSHVLWVIGGRISEYYKVTEETERILKVQVDGGINCG